MDQETIYRKTAEGAEAIAARHPALGPRRRSLLILVDGRRSCGELAALGLEAMEESMQALLAQGFIEPVGQRAPAAAAGQASRRAAATRPPVPLAQAQRFAVRRLNDLLGPGAEDLCLRLEKTRTSQEFLAALRRTEAAVRQAVGPQLAARFLKEVQDLQPA